MNNLSDDERQAIMEEIDPDWPSHFFSWEAAWDWYWEYCDLEKAINERQENENELQAWWVIQDQDDNWIQENG